MRDALKRVAAIEAKLFPGGLLLQAWEREAGRVVVRSSGVDSMQADDESEAAFFARAAKAIGRAPVVWVSPQDAAL